ncbi:Gfo/Idh/MocA family oxidoreductase [candidate division KSB1 bacterium]|nr:Gfo/Idh/MocA family oxidoreductase [candidate division KSB1 bacterium]
MKKITRRNFVKTTLITGAASILPVAMNSKSSYARILGANDEIRVAVVGFNSKGAQHIGVFRNIPGVRIVALCDVDKDILNREAAKFAESNEKVDKYTDVRKLLDDKNIDVVVIATPNHWHSLIAIWAIQAGKDVYVEKPISHNIWEGRKVVEAARKYNRIVQAGTQNRSDTGFREAYSYIKEGNLGKILWTYGLWYKKRESIGRVDKAQPVPPQIDYNLWTGPAKLEPLMRKNLHYDWHWFWNTGNGDMANIGVHQIDDCRFILDNPDLPKRVISLGGRFNFDDNAETPNTQLAVFEFESAPPMYIETRNLTMKKGINAMDHIRGVREGNIIQCEHGYFGGGRGGGWIFDNDHKKIKQFPGDGGGGHQANFINAVRSRKREELHADILQGHISSVLCHMANISYQIGKETPSELIRELFQQDKQASEAYDRIQNHLQANEVDLLKTPVMLGPWLEIDIKKEKFKGEFGKAANKYVSRKYRKPFVVPKKV